MADLLDFAGVRAFTTNADAGAGYVARFYQSGTTTPVTVYTSSDLGTAHGTSVTADASGVFPAVWVSTGTVKCTIETPAGAVVQTIDPVFSHSTATGASGVGFEPTVDLPFTNVQDAIEGAAASAASGFTPYGLGITGNADLLANIDATNIGAGAYRFDGTTTGTYPTGVAAADTGLVETWRQASATAMQVLYHATTDRVFHRRMAASVWGSWRENVEVNQGAAEGDTIYRGASAWTRLAKGTAGQVLKMNIGATAPEWGSGGDRVLLATKTASASATLDFTEFNNAVYRRYEFELDALRPATSGAELILRMSTDGGASYAAAAGNYRWSFGGTTSAAVYTQASTSDTGISLARTIGNGAGNFGVYGTVDILAAPQSGERTIALCQLAYETSSGQSAQITGSGIRLATQDTDAVRFLCDSGNIASGTIRMYGII